MHLEFNRNYKTKCRRQFAINQLSKFSETIAIERHKIMCWNLHGFVRRNTLLLRSIILHYNNTKEYVFFVAVAPAAAAANSQCRVNQCGNTTLILLLWWMKSWIALYSSTHFSLLLFFWFAFHCVDFSHSGSFLIFSTKNPSQATVLNVHLYSFTLWLPIEQF